MSLQPVSPVGHDQTNQPAQQLREVPQTWISSLITLSGKGVPVECITNVVFLSGNVLNCAQVCRNWYNATEASYPLILETYERQDKNIRFFIPEARSSAFEAVKRTYLTFMKSTHVPHIWSEVSALNRPMPLDLDPVEEIIEDANRLRFFEKISRSVPVYKPPLLEGDLVQKSLTLRNWIKNSQTSQPSLDQVINPSFAGLLLTTIPPEIGKCANLQELSLGHNQLKALPQEISQLTNLTGLNLIDNDIATIPTQVFQLTNLTELNLANNKITTVPKQINQLRNLETLILFGNPLAFLPVELSQLTNLRTFDLSLSNMTTWPEPFQIRLEAIADLIALDKIVTAFKQKKIEEALEMFQELSTDTKNGIYKELDKIIIKRGAEFWPNTKYNGCAEDVFLCLYGQDILASNQDWIEAIMNFIKR